MLSVYLCEGSSFSNKRVLSSSASTLHSSIAATLSEFDASRVTRRVSPAAGGMLGWVQLNALCVYAFLSGRTSSQQLRNLAGHALTKEHMELLIA